MESRLSQKDIIKVIFARIPELKGWIEQTQLFTTIKAGLEQARKQKLSYYIIQSNEITLKLNIYTQIDKVEDLPVELIGVFYRNSPYYNSIDMTVRNILALT